MLVRLCSVSTDRHLRVFIQERLWKSSWAGSRNWEGSWWSSATPLVPSLGKLWNTPCLECIQDVVLDVRNKSVTCNLYKNPLFQESVTCSLALSCSPFITAGKSTECPAKGTCEFPPLSHQWEDLVPAWWLDVLAHQSAGLTRENNWPLQSQKSFLSRRTRQSWWLSPVT